MDLDDLDINIVGLPPVAPAQHAAASSPSRRSSGRGSEGRGGGHAEPGGRRSRVKGRSGDGAGAGDGAAGSPGAKGADVPAPAPAGATVNGGSTRRVGKKKKRMQRPQPPGSHAVPASSTQAVASGLGGATRRAGKKDSRSTPTAAQPYGAGSASKVPVPAPAAELMQRAEEAAAPARGKKREGKAQRGMDAKRQKPHSSGLASSFDKLKLHSSLARQLSYLKFEECTPIQKLAVPMALSGDRDVMLRAPTGSGKTLAFLLPILNQVLERGCKRADGTLAIILSPTKELALQTLKVAQDLLRMSPAMVCGAIAGGEKPKSEKARLRKGMSILCATPGRLAYHLEHTASLKLDELRHLALDEADRLLDMGFEPQVRRIYQKFKRDSQGTLQTLLASATLTAAVRRLGEFCLRKGAGWADADAAAEPKDVQEDEGPPEGAPEFCVPSTLVQWYCEVPCKDRLPALIASLLSKASVQGEDERDGGSPGGKKAIVFFSSCASVDFHHDLFLDVPWPSKDGSARRQAPVRKARRGKDGFVYYKGDDDGSDDENDQEEEEEEGANGGAVGDKDPTSTQSKIFVQTPLYKLHGNLTAEERAGYIADFSRAPGGALLASDAAARGLDFPQIDWIIQYDPPQRAEEYLHRVGRTARIGRKGESVIFLQPSELGFLEVLKAKGVSNIQRLELRHVMTWVMQHPGTPIQLARARDIPSLLLSNFKTRVEGCQPLTKLARSAFLAAMKAYKAFPRELRQCFDFRQLHSGHFATSFALRETPGEVSKKAIVDATAGDAPGGKAQKGQKGQKPSQGKGNEGKGKGSDGKGKGGDRDQGAQRRPGKPRGGTSASKGAGKAARGGEQLQPMRKRKAQMLGAASEFAG